MRTNKMLYKRSKRLKAGVYVKDIEFSSGELVSIDEDAIVVIVGPNNSGKSATLKAINEYVRNGKSNSPVIKNVEIVSSGDKDSWVEYFKSEALQNFDGNQQSTFSGLGYSFLEQNIDHYKNGLSEGRGVGDLSQAFCNFLGTEQRLSATNPPQNINMTKHAPQHPIHHLQRDDKIEEKFSKIFNKAFGKDLIVHRNAGDSVPLHVGDKPELLDGEDRVSIDYLKRLEKLPYLHEQGDGMKSFVGVMLNTMISNKSITLIDEPEAFLHPPQARLLGQMLAKNEKRSGQLIISTHSGDFLRGVVDSSPKNLQIIRIMRDGDTNQISRLSKDELSEIWKDPLLRHSNILDGLFHEKVVVCESDSDCRFFSAISQVNYEKNDKTYPDVLLTHCGGKHRIPTVVKALKNLGVPVSVVADFDVLNSNHPLRDIIESMNGEWSKVEKDWKIIKQGVESKKPELTSDDVKIEIGEILDKITDKSFPSSSKKKIEAILKRSSAWSHAKSTGKYYIPSGDGSQAFDNLIKYVNSLGLFIVEVGELECFVKSVGNHGPKWVAEVLTRDINNDPEFEVAKSFVARII